MVAFSFGFAAPKVNAAKRPHVHYQQSLRKSVAAKRASGSVLRLADPALANVNPVWNGNGRLAKSESEEPRVSDRFDRFLPLAGVLAGLLFSVGLVVPGAGQPDRACQVCWPADDALSPSPRDP